MIRIAIAVKDGKMIEDSVLMPKTPMKDIAIMLYRLEELKLQLLNLGWIEGDNEENEEES